MAISGSTYTGTGDLLISGSVILGDHCADSIQVSGSLTASCDGLFLDNKKLYFVL